MGIFGILANTQIAYRFQLADCLDGGRWRGPYDSSYAHIAGLPLAGEVLLGFPLNYGEYDPSPRPYALIGPEIFFFRIAFISSESDASHHPTHFDPTYTDNFTTLV